MRLFRRGRVWYAQVYDANGKRHQITTKCHDKEAAERVARRMERDSADPRQAAQRAATLGGALARLLTRREEEANAGRRSHDTVDFYARKSETLLRVLGAEVSLMDVTADLVDGFVSTRRGEGVSDGTIHKELVTLRAALKLAKRAGEFAGDLGEVLPVAFSPAYRPRTRWLTEDEVGRLIRELKPDRGARVAFIVATSACWRETELAERGDVVGSEVLIRGTKRSSRLRRVPVVTPPQQQLLAYAVANAGGDGARLFRPWPSVRRDLRAACARAGMEPCSPNDLRRTCATWLRRMGAAPDLIAPVLGHVDTRMVERVYGRLSVDDLRARISAATCSDIAADGRDSVDAAGRDGADAHADAHAVTDEKQKKNPPVTAGLRLPGDGIEPPARGFSIAAQRVETTRKRRSG